MSVTSIGVVHVSLAGAPVCESPGVWVGVALLTLPGGRLAPLAVRRPRPVAVRDAIVILDARAHDGDLLAVVEPASGTVTGLDSRTRRRHAA